MSVRCNASRTPLSEPLELPVSRRRVPNRLAKAALTESLADPNSGRPNERHVELYRRWATAGRAGAGRGEVGGGGPGSRGRIGGGCGMILSGNVMIDRRHRENPRNVVLDERSDLRDFEAWAKATRGCDGEGNDGNGGNDVLAIMQVSHPGRQCPLSSTRFEVTPVSASSARESRLALPGLLGRIAGRLLMRPARALRADEIPALVARYAACARRAELSGWDGVEVHAAHGYLIAQFLSPTSNLRADGYGVDAAGRRRLLVEVVSAIRGATSPEFVVGVKLNTKDRSTDGPERERECLDLIRTLCDSRQLDFIELSGGCYEDGMMMRDAGGTGPFGSFARKLRDEVMSNLDDEVPRIVLTGGFRTKEGMEEAVRRKVCDMIGLGRPIVMDPDFPADLLSTGPEEVRSICFPMKMPVLQEILEPALDNLWHQRQLHRMSKGQAPDPSLSYLYTLVVDFFRVYVWDLRFRGHGDYHSSYEEGDPKAMKSA